MKPLYFLRNALLFCIPACCLLNGCAGGAETSFTPKQNASFTAEAELEYGSGQTASLTVTRYEKAQWEAAFTAPPSLEGVVLQFEGNAVSASYKGLAFSVPRSALPAKNMLVIAAEALDQAAETAPLTCTEQSDGTWSYAGESDAGSYTLTFSADGTPAVLEMPAQPFTIRFSGYSVLSAAPSQTTAVSPSEEPPRASSSGGNELSALNE